MGSEVSALRSDIKKHANIGRMYNKYLEPMLTVVQRYVELVEEGEGLRGAAMDDERLEEAMNDPNRLLFISTEVELIAENKKAFEVLLSAVISYNMLELSPEIDPIVHRRFGIFKREPQPMPVYAVIEAKDVEKYRISVLRLAVRCLRIICICEEVRNRLYKMDGEVWLNQAVLENPGDEYIKGDVRRIFRTIYGENQAVKRIAIVGLEQVKEVMTEYPENAVVQLAGIKRISDLLHRDADNEKTETLTAESMVIARQFDLFPTIGSSMKMFRVSEYELYTAACRLNKALSEDERNCKIIGQHHGVEGAVDLLKYARGFYRQENEAPESDFEELRQINPIANLTLAEVGQQSLWTLDALARAQYNIVLMKRARLKYILQEIIINPNTKEVGTKLIVPRRLKRIKWDTIQTVRNDED